MLITNVDDIQYHNTCYLSVELQILSVHIPLKLKFV